MSKKLLPALILLLVQTFYFQTVEKAETPEEAKSRLQKEAIAFLRETQGDVNTMRSLENRISFSSELAGLMWFHDEREARGMFGAVVADFRELLIKYDAQLNALGPPEDGDSNSYRRGFLGGDLSERSRLRRKFDIAMMVRQQIAVSLAEHDGDLAYSFFIDSMAAISNPEVRKSAEESEGMFLNQLVVQIAKSNAAKAAQLAGKSLEKGINYQHVTMLRAIYEKDADKGAEFAATLVSRAKSEKLTSGDLWVISSLLNFGEETLEKSRTPGGKKAALSQQDLRDLAEALAGIILSSDDTEGLSHVDKIEKYAPGRAIQIRSRLARKKTDANSASVASNAVAYGEAYASAPPPPMSANANVSVAQAAEKKMFDDVAKLGKKELPKEERDRIIADARKLIATTKGREQKITALSAIASQVAAAGDRDLADELLREAETFVNPSPKNYQDFMMSWMLASGYASAKSDRAFTLLEETIQRVNGTIEAFVRVGEFVDVAEEMIVDGEVQLGAFGGSMVRGLTGELGMADNTIKLLVDHDFTKTKNLTNRFERPEVRVLAKMMVIRAVLDAKKPDVRQEDAISDVPMDVVN